ncbi:MAG TPA: exosortase A [Terriglobales bacterium]|nr:exosortase A [Terriglobales bacterium]
MSTNVQPIVPAAPEIVISDRSYSYWYAAAVLVGTAIVACLVLFWQTVRLTLHTWQSSETYSYGYLILPIVAYVLWDRRRRLHAVPVRPYWPALLLLAGSGFMWLVANVADIRVGQQLALVCAVDSMVLLIVGWRAARTLAAPMLILFFTIPFGDGVVPKLQDLTAAVATGLLNISHVPAVLEGRVITVPGMRWQVAEACSGARYLLSSAILGVVCASLIFRSWKRRALLIAASVAVPVLANCLRAYGIIMLGYLSNNALAHGIDHIIYGWIFFLFCMLLVFGIAARHAEHPKEPNLLPLDSRLRSESLPRLGFAAVLGCAVLGLPMHGATVLHARDIANPISVAAGPKTNAAWHVSPDFPTHWVSPVLDTFVGGADTYLPTSSENNDRPVYLFLGSSRSSARVLDSGERFLNLHYWTLLSEQSKTITLQGHTLRVRELNTQGPYHRRLIWMWCMVNGTPANTELEVKLLQAKSVLAQSTGTVHIVAVAADYDFDPNEAVPALTSFLDSATPTVIGNARQ